MSKLTIKDKIRELLDGFKWAVHNKNTSAVIIIDGKSGLGKTTLGCQMGEYCDPNFSLNKLHYNPRTFLEGGDGKIGLKQAQKGDFILFDEAMLISNRAAMSEINRMVIAAMSMIRSKNIFVGFCVNSIFDLDKNLAIFRADVLFSLYGDSLVDRGKVMAFFKGLDGRDRLKELYLKGKKYYDYSRPKSNFNTEFNSYFPFDQEEYDRQKQEGVNDFLESLGRKGLSNNKTMEQRDKMIEYMLRNSNLTQKQIAEIIGVSYRTIQRSHARLKDSKEIQVDNPFLHQTESVLVSSSE